MDEKTEKQFQTAIETEDLADELDIDIETATSELIELEDGSVLINYTDVKSPFEDPEFYTNLAEALSATESLSLASTYLDFVKIDRESRHLRDELYEEGLRRTGLGEPSPGGAEFDGAAKVTHPLLAEACVDFEATTVKELLPPDAIVKSVVRSKDDPQALKRAEAKVHFINWQINEQIPEYRDEMESMLSQVPMGGSQFFKWYYSPALRRPACEFVPLDHIFIPAACSSFYGAPRFTEMETIPYVTLRERISSGLYLDVDDIIPSDISPSAETTLTEQANDKIEGREDPARNVDAVRVIYHIHTWLELEEDPITKGKRAPYILTVDDLTTSILALYRNWEAGDDTYTRLEWIVEFPFIKWRGPLGLSLPHLMGDLAASATGALRALLDSAHASNVPSLLKLKTDGTSGQVVRPQVGQVTEVEAPVGTDDVRKIFMALPFNPPSQVLFELLGWLSQVGKGVVTTAEEKISDLNNQTPVGTTIALIEQGAKVFNSIHARLHRAQTRSIKILCRLNHWYLEEMSNGSGQTVKVKDFANNSDIRPVSDPNIISDTHRIAQAQAVLQLSNMAKNPGIYDERALHKYMLEVLRIPNSQEFLPDPRGKVESNPVLENVQMSMGETAAAYPDQDHIAHIISHFAFYLNPVYGGNPLIAPGYAGELVKHLKQHFALHYLQSMKHDVEKTVGEDIFHLNEEKPLSVSAQQALAMASLDVAQKSHSQLKEFIPMIQDLMKKVQESTKSRQEQALMSDPSAAVLLRTEKAKHEMEMARLKQEQRFKYEELAARVEELSAQLHGETLRNAENAAVQLGVAAMNNSAKERIEDKKLQHQLDQLDLENQHAMDQLAIQAQHSAQADLRQHGLAAEQSQAANAAAQLQGDIAHQQNLEKQNLANQQAIQQGGIKHQQALQQGSQQHQQGLEQQSQQQRGEAFLGTLPLVAQQLGANATTPRGKVVQDLVNQGKGNDGNPRN